VSNQHATVAPILSVCDLQTYFFPDEGTVKAVDGATFDLLPRTTLGIVGESGCGKSVTALSILRLIPQPPGRIVSGSILLNGRDLVAAPERDLRRIRGNAVSMIFQEPMTSLNPVFRVGRQVAAVLRLHRGLSAPAAREAAVDLFARVGIPSPASRVDDYPHQMSGGMRQRVMIAMAMACGPSLLIADEPTTALDVTIQAQIVELVTRMREQLGMALIWITHDLGVVAGLAERVIVMYAGMIVEEADVDSLFEHPRHPYTLALLGALPRVDRRRDDRLKSIPGAPPSLLVEPRGCPFAPRCEYVIDHCLAERPPLMPVSPTQRSACWVLAGGE